MLRLFPLFVIGLLWLLPVPLVSASLPSCGEAPYSVIVNVHGVKSGEGSVTVALYDDDPQHFLKSGKKVGQVRVPAQQEVTTACFAVSYPGEHAIAVYHDEDGNGKLTQSWWGLPTEGFGFSNNPTVLLAPPDLAETVVFISSEQTVLDITIRY